ncbi:MAG: hypothetical protein WCT32_03855 [Patescibacteria group bacterium]|jgi:uncharacterized repeat protein (TIGR01451 family)
MKSIQNVTSSSKGGFWTKTKKLLIGVVALASIVSAVALPGTDVKNAEAQQARTPRFNFLGPAEDGSNEGDIEMFMAGKTTSNTWSDPLNNVNIGDRIAFMVYFHNGVPDTVAHRTTIRVDFPAGEHTQLVGTSWLWSDETDPIRDTVINGQVKGNSGVTLNLPVAGRIEYVNGSTKKFTFPNGPDTAPVIANLPDGIANTGVNIGDIQGCWPYSGYVTFLADIKGRPNIGIDKHVSLAGSDDWQKSVGATGNVHPGDEVAFRLTVNNLGTAAATQVTIKDTLPPALSLVAGSTRLWTSPTAFTTLPDTIATTGISMPDIAPGTGGIRYITYRTRIGNLPVGEWTLNNLAKVFMNNVEQDRDQATVFVVSLAPAGLTLTKEVLVNGNPVVNPTVKFLEDITYRIKVTNSGGVNMTNVIVRDALPQFVNYVSGSTRVDGNTVNDQIITTGGINIGTIAPGATKTIILKGNVYGCPPAGTYPLVNTAYAKADGIAEKTATANAVVVAAAPNLPPTN